jgi:hypothetical protein
MQITDLDYLKYLDDEAWIEEFCTACDAAATNPHYLDEHYAICAELAEVDYELRREDDLEDSQSQDIRNYVEDVTGKPAFTPDLVAEYYAWTAGYGPEPIFAWMLERHADWDCAVEMAKLREESLKLRPNATQPPPNSRPLPPLTAERSTQARLCGAVSTSLITCSGT